MGPIRIWPGGLCVARSIGDADAGLDVVPIPHVKQVGRPTYDYAWCDHSHLAGIIILHLSKLI